MAGTRGIRESGWRAAGGRGFTLMELMVVLTIAGILASVAVPLFGKYLKKAKTTEARLNLRKIYDGEITYYHEEQTTGAGVLLPKAFVSNPPTPTTPGLQKQAGDFSTLNWQLLKFAPDGPVFYSYSTLAEGTGTSASFTARAEGDIDGDGTTSLFERIATVNASGEPEGVGAIFSMDDLE